MEKIQTKSLRIFVATLIGIPLILNLLSFLLKISYNNFYSASYYILMMGICISVIALSNVGNKSIFKVVAGGGYLTSSFLFIYTMFKGEWSLALISDIKWLFILLQVDFALLFIGTLLYKRTKARKLRFA